MLGILKRHRRPRAGRRERRVPDGHTRIVFAGLGEPTPLLVAFALARRYAHQGLDATVLSSRPPGDAHPDAVQWARQAGGGTLHEPSGTIRPDDLRQADLAVTIGAPGAPRPVLVDVPVEDWTVPAVSDQDDLVRLRGELAERVDSLASRVLGAGMLPPEAA